MFIDTPSLSFSPYNNCNQIYALSYNDVKSLIHEFSELDIGQLIFGNKADYVTSLRVYPRKIGVSSGIRVPIVINGREVTTEGQPLSYNAASNNKLIPGGRSLFDVFDLDRTINASIYGKNDFRSYPPYTDYKLFLPFIGIVDVDILPYRNYKYMYIDIYLDYSSGRGMYGIYPSNHDPAEGDGTDFTYPIYTQLFECEIGIDVPLSGTNTAEIANKLMLSAIGTAIGFGLGPIAYKTAAWGATRRLTKGGNFTKRGQAIGELAQREQNIKTVNGAVQSLNNNAMRPINCSGQGSGYLMTSSWHIPLLYAIVRDISDPSAYAGLCGRPLMQVKQLSELTGYTECLEVHLENMPSATSTELELIEDLLHSGVIL